MNRIVTAFKEHKEFKNEKHWDANDMTFKKDCQTPPHYADTVEIIINKGTVGDIYIGGTRFELAGQQAFFIPPDTVHSMHYKMCDGVVTVLKINVDTIKPYINIDKLLSAHGIGISELSYRITEVDCAENLSYAFRNESSILNVSTEILSFFSTLAAQSGSDGKTVERHASDSEELRSVISWTEQNYTKKISLSHAAGFLGYNKNYFCKKFKDATGVTYVNYLQTLRISHACSLLRMGRTISDVCTECGFENESYFIKLFRQKVGITPKKYATMGKKRTE